jgi:translation initiation factor IF-2
LLFKLYYLFKILSTNFRTKNLLYIIGNLENGQINKIVVELKHMKIAELAKQLEITPKVLREKIDSFGFDIGKKARTIKDKTAEEIIEKVNKEKEFLEKGQVEEAEKEIQEEKPIEEVAKKEVEIPEVIMVKDFAAKVQMPVTEVIRELVKNGVMASINENIDYETAAIIADDLGYSVKKEIIKEEIGPQIEVSKKDLKVRPPVITVVGHIDHGKTTLIDYIRKTSVASGESGGITQHIGAYQIEIADGKDGKKKRKVTFLDTPGHEAFVAMREHGTKIADIAILIVAASEGVMPQTKEAINHAKSAGVPIIVAINKIDEPGADVEKVKKQLADLGLNPEDWGGSTIMVPISAKKGTGVKELLEMILLTTDLEKIKASYSGFANAVVIESHMDVQKGPVATVLIKNGILKVKDYITSGEMVGKIRIMENYLGERIKEASPSMPVRIYGLPSVPDYGDLVYVFGSEKDARNYLISSQKKQSVKSLVNSDTKSINSEDLKLNLIIKADVAGSLKAVVDAIKNLKGEGGAIHLISASVGGISESDVLTAETTNAIIIGFRVTPSTSAGELASSKKIKMVFFQVIYELIDEVKKMLKDLIGPIRVRSEIGTGKVLALFQKTKDSQIIGVKVTGGKIVLGSEIEVFRVSSDGADEKSIGISSIKSLKIQQQNVREIVEGSDCGLGIENGIDVQVNDKLKIYSVEEKEAEIK